MKVIDNFLSEVDFLNLNAFLFGPLISWNYTDLKDLEIPDDNLASSHFYHIFHDHEGVSDRFYMLNPLIIKLKISAIYRIKANLDPYRGNEGYKGIFHYDFINSENQPSKNMTTGIYYANTNNGYTELEDGTIVESVANRMLLFPSNTLHRGVTQTDTKKRVVINFNFYTEEGG